MFLNQNVDGEYRDELLSLQQRLESKIQVCGDHHGMKNKTKLTIPYRFPGHFSIN